MPECLGRFVFTLAPLALALCACGSSTARYPFHDQRGRQCVRTCQGSTCDFTCDAVPAPTNGCGDAGMFTPCFTAAFFTPGAASDQRSGLCDSCCWRTDAGKISGWMPQDCSPIVCQQAADCAFGDTSCRSGICESTRCYADGGCPAGLTCVGGACAVGK